MTRSSHCWCWLLSLLMLISPNSMAIAQQAQDLKQAEPDTTLLADPPIVEVPRVVADPLDITYLLPQSCAVLSVRPQEIINSPIFKLLPFEVLQAASVHHTGIDALLVDRLLVSVEPPTGGPPNYAVMASFSAPVAAKLLPQAVARMERLEEDRPHYKSAQPLEPSLYFPEDDVLLATPEATLQKFLLGETVQTDRELHKRLQAAADDDLYVGVDFVPLRPLANAAMMQAPIPAELGHLYLAPDLIKLIELRVNVSDDGTSELVVEANNAEDAEKLENIVLKTVDLIKTTASKEVERLKADPDPVQQALGRYQERLMNELVVASMPKREGEKLVIFRASGEKSQGRILTVAVSGVLAGLLLPAVQAARVAARRASSMNNVKNIVLALFNYESANKAFPAHANYADGEPLLSWRVHILPYLGEQELYEQFHLDEPWDSEHNKTLIAKMPAVFINPNSKLTPEEGRTHYLGVKGAGMAFNGTDGGTKFSDFTDGLSRSIMVVQVNDERATTWTKPDDWELDEKNVLKGLPGAGGFLVGWADGSVAFMSDDVDKDAFKTWLTIAGGESVSRP